MKKKNTLRKLEDTSWLAQTIKDKMEVSFAKDGLYASTKSKAYSVLHSIVNEADNESNTGIYYDDMGYNGRGIVICDIRGTEDLSREYMKSMLMGMQARYTNDDGSYIISALITNDLNSATIYNISDLLYAISSK